MKLIDRYILKNFLLTLLFSLVVLCVIFIIVNLIEKMDKFIDNKLGFMDIARYYMYFLPDILKMLIPVAVLISSLFTVGRLSNLNEVTAMKSGGMSLYRLMLPFVIVATMISLGHLYFNAWLVPQANKHKFLMENKFMNNSNEEIISNFYYRESPEINISIGFYEPTSSIAYNTSIEYYSPRPKQRLVKKLSARSMQWDSAKKVWNLQNVIVRKFDSSSVTAERVDDMPIKLNADGNRMQEIQKQQSQMTYPEIRDYLNFLRAGGKDITRLETEYYANYSFPFANLILIFFSIPFASVKKKNGLAVQIAAAMAIGFTYLVFWQVGQSVGIAMQLNPMISGWLANIIFIVFGIGVMLKTRT